MSEFDGRIVLVTGGASGLGLGAVQVLAARGANVWIADRQYEAAREMLASDPSLYRGVQVVPIDVADPASVVAAFDAVERESGVVTHLVNAAGINARISSFDVTSADWSRVLGVNLNGTFFVAQTMARRLRAANKKGSIVNVASMLAHYGASNLAPYGASKGGVVMITRCLATEWAPFGIRVNAVSPGYIETAMTRRMLSLESYGGAILARTPMARFGTAEDVGRVIAFLLSDDAAFVTGQILPVDGGITGGDPAVSPPTDEQIAAQLGLN